MKDLNLKTKGAAPRYDNDAGQVGLDGFRQLLPIGASLISAALTKRFAFRHVDWRRM